MKVLLKAEGAAQVQHDHQRPRGRRSLHWIRGIRMEAQAVIHSPSLDQGVSGVLQLQNPGNWSGEF